MSIAAYRGLLAEPGLRRLAIANACALFTAAGLDAPLAVAAPLAGMFLGPVLATLFGAAASAAIGGARTIAGHAPGPFGRKEP